MLRRRQGFCFAAEQEAIESAVRAAGCDHRPWHALTSTEEVKMLTFRRSAGEGIVIGDSIIITVLEVDEDHVRLVIEDRERGDDVRIVDWPQPEGLDPDFDVGEGI
jgi:hypothetical protein